MTDKDVQERIDRLTALSTAGPASLHPYHDHNGFEQHERLQADLRTFLSELDGLKAEVARLTGANGQLRRELSYEGDQRERADRAEAKLASTEKAALEAMASRDGEIEDLQAKLSSLGRGSGDVVGLVEALKPFAREAERIEAQADPETPFDDDLNADAWLSMGELRAARQALATFTTPSEGEEP